MKVRIEKFRTRIRNQKGFTLIELMATLVILAIIVAIAVPAVGNITAKAKAQAFDSNAAMMVNAAELAHVAGLEPDLQMPKVAQDWQETRGVYSVEYLIDEGFLKMDKAATKAPYDKQYIDSGKFSYDEGVSEEQNLLVLMENEEETGMYQLIFFYAPDHGR